uniref:COX assembly mitochondrial protein n=1 Tax=Corethron hystrix TaxID=216773 RepID=A0A7S1BDD3_9STRA|mmetsp:Transcript_23253/g.53126  ORF Transcript_23253/g.53126 Transcript_23253/m.53126 type:complete len:103 (+) Transcript_23253:182-490(+)
MHPPLHKVDGACKDVVLALESCHANFPYRKYVGACNNQKALLDICFRADKKERQSRGLEVVDASRRMQVAGNVGATTDLSTPFAAWEAEMERRNQSKNTTRA